MISAVKRKIAEEIIEAEGMAPVKDDEITPADLAEVSGVTPEAARRALDRLWKAGKMEKFDRRDANNRPVVAYRKKEA